MFIHLIILVISTTPDDQLQRSLTITDHHWPSLTGWLWCIIPPGWFVEMDNKDWMVSKGYHSLCGKGCVRPSRLLRLFGVGGEGLLCRPGGYVSTDKNRDQGIRRRKQLLGMWMPGLFHRPDALVSVGGLFVVVGRGLYVWGGWEMVRMQSD